MCFRRRRRLLWGRYPRYVLHLFDSTRLDIDVKARQSLPFPPRTPEHAGEAIDGSVTAVELPLSASPINVSWSSSEASVESPTMRAMTTRERGTTSAGPASGHAAPVLPTHNEHAFHAAEPRVITPAVTAILAGGAAAAVPSSDETPSRGAPQGPLADRNGNPLSPPGLGRPDTAALRLSLLNDELLVDATGEPVYDGGRNADHLKSHDEGSVGSEFFRFFSTPPRFVDPPQQAAQVHNGIQAAGLQDAAYVGRQSVDNGELTCSDALVDPPHTASKRPWTGTPDPEGEMRGLRRLRPAGTTPPMRSSSRLAGGLYCASNPWASELTTTLSRAENCGREGSFEPVASSTPTVPVPLLDQSQGMRPRTSGGDRRPFTSTHAPERRASYPMRANHERTASERSPGDPLRPDEDPEARMSVDNATDRSPSPESPKEKKNKGKKRATTAELEAESQDTEDPREPRTGYNDWDESQLIQARQESLRQSLRDRAGERAYGNHVRQESQSGGAGPSIARCGAPAHYHEATRSILPTVREERVSYSREHDVDRSRARAADRDEGYAGMGHDSARSERYAPYSERGRARSEFVPLPNTRAADYLSTRRVNGMPQRSPVSRVHGLQRSPSPMDEARENDIHDAPYCFNGPRYTGREAAEPLPHPRVSRGPESMPHDENEDVWEREPADDWEQERQPREDGEVLPTALWGHDMQDSTILTPIPREGYPTIHRDDPETALRGMALDWMREVWSDPPNSDVLVQVFNYRYTEDDVLNRRVAGALRWAFETMTGETGFDVVPPEPEEGERRRTRDLPSIWAIRGLSERATTLAVERGTWSFRAISFIATPRSTPAQTWLFALDGFLEANAQKIRLAVLRVLQEEQMQHWMRAMISANPTYAGIPEADAMNELLDSLRVDILQLGNGGYVANIHMLPPTRNLREWRAWVAELRLRQYRTFAIGTGRVRYVAPCPGCTSVTHPAHQCPFPRIRGWQGPQTGEGVFGDRRRREGGPDDGTDRDGTSRVWRSDERMGVRRAPRDDRSRQDTPRPRRGDRHDRNNRHDRDAQRDRNGRDNRNGRGFPPKRGGGKGSGRDEWRS